MKQKLLLVIVVISTLVTTTSCSSVKGIFGKSSSDEAKQSGKIEKVEKEQNRNLAGKMDQVAILASGTGYALQKVTNKEPAVTVAYDINTRVESLAGKPDLDAEKEMWKTVDQLMSQIKTEREKGEKALLKKDKEISELQDETKLLLASKDEAVSKYMKMSQDAAMLADTRKAELDDYKGWFGLKAVGKGLWQFVRTVTWWLIGGSVLFIILRFASMINPIAASVFSIVERIASWGINIITTLAPKALEKAGAISKIAYDNMSLVLRKIVDNIQNIKQLEAKTGQPITLKELLNELDKSMDVKDKEIVTKIKKDLGY